MSEWRQVDLSSVAELTVGFVGTMARHYESSGVPFLRSQNVSPHRLDLADVKYISEQFHRHIEKSALRPGDVVTVRTGNAGITAVVPSWLERSNCADLVITRPGPELDARWLSYYMNSAATHAISTELVGAVQQHFNVGAAKRTRLALPPLPEQQAIAEVLGALDDKIASNLALIATAREYALLISRVHAPMTRLGDVVIHRSRQVQPANMSEEEVDLFSLPGFDSGVGAERVHPSEIKSGKFLIEGSVVLVSKLNPRIPRIWPIDEDGSVVPKFASTEFLVLEPFTCTPDVLWALLSQPEFTSALEGQVAGTSGSHQRVRPADLLSTRIPDPRHISPQLHEDINGVLAPVRMLLRQNRTLAATRDALLPALMSGKLRVRDAERIAAEAGA